MQFFVFDFDSPSLKSREIGNPLSRGLTKDTMPLLLLLFPFFFFLFFSFFLTTAGRQTGSIKQAVTS